MHFSFNFTLVTAGRLDDSEIMAAAYSSLSQQQKRRRLELQNQERMTDAELLMVESEAVGAMFQDRAIRLNDLYMAEPEVLSPQSRQEQISLRAEVGKLKKAERGGANPLLDCRAETLSNNDLKARAKILKKTKGVYPGHDGSYDTNKLMKARDSRLHPHEITRRHLLMAMEGEEIEPEDGFVFTGGKTDIDIRLLTKNLTTEQSTRRRLLCDLPEFKIHLGKVARKTTPSDSEESVGDTEIDYEHMKLDEFIEHHWQIGTSMTEGLDERELAMANPKELTEGGQVTRKMLRQRASDAKYRRQKDSTTWRKERAEQRNLQRKRKQ